MRAEADVLVVGAGPAGAITARQLARDGFQVVLADAKAFPRPKPCGEFLGPECERQLEAVGLGGLLARLGAWPVRGMRLSSARASTEGRFRALAIGEAAPGSPHGFGVRRSRFDAALVDAAVAAGVTLLPRHAFEAVWRGATGSIAGAWLREPDGELRCHRARWLVGADGVHSRVARALGVQRPIRGLDQFALAAHFEHVQPLGTADVHLLPGGFLAATTVDGGLYGVNLVLPRARLAARAEPGWDGFVQRHLDAAPQLAARLRGAMRTTRWRGTGPLGFTTSSVAVPGAALVGDAAGYVDPLTGEGIYFALFGGRALARALGIALHEPQRAALALAGYTRERRREIGPRLAAARLLQRGLRHPRIVHAAVRALARWPALADLMVTMTGDSIHPRDLLRPAFWRSFAGAAAR